MTINVPVSHPGAGRDTSLEGKRRREKTGTSEKTEQNVGKLTLLLTVSIIPKTVSN